MGEPKSVDRGEFDDTGEIYPPEYDGELFVDMGDVLSTDTEVDGEAEPNESRHEVCGSWIDCI